MDKEEKKAVIVIIIFGLLMFASGSIIFSIKTKGIPEKELKKDHWVKKYNKITTENLNDNVTTDIVNKCNTHKREEQLNCVIQQVSQFYNFSYNNDSIRTPSEYKEKGGVCGDIIIVYSTVFKRLNWSIEFVFPDQTNHTFVVISQKDIYCLIDGLLADCVHLEP